MMQIFKKLKDFLVSKLGKNQTLTIQELDPTEPDLPAEVVLFDLEESVSQCGRKDCDCECGSDSNKESGWEVLHNESAQSHPQTEDAAEIILNPVEVIKQEVHVDPVEEPKKTEKKSKGRPKKKSTETTKEKSADKKSSAKPKKSYYKKKKKSKDAE